VGVALRDEILAIRVALRAQTASDAQFRLVDVDDLERQVDDIHETPETCVERGRRIDVQLGYVELPNC